MLSTSKVPRGGLGQFRADGKQRPGPLAVVGSGYDIDTVLWADSQLVALRNHDVASLDWDNLAEEIADLGKSAKHAVWSHLSVLQMHLIKYELQPERRSNSWRMSIRNARRELQFLLEDSPSLRPYLLRNKRTDWPRSVSPAPDAVPRAARPLLSIFDRTRADAYEDALEEMEMSGRPTCTAWSVEQALDFDFLP